MRGRPFLLAREYAARVESFDLSPEGGYSLRESAGFIEAWHEAPSEGGRTEGHLHLAFLTNRDWSPVGVCLTPDASGSVHGKAYGVAPADDLLVPTPRLLSRAADATPWPHPRSHNPVPPPPHLLLLNSRP